MGKTVVFGCKECGWPQVREKDGKLFCASCGTWFEKNVETDEERDARVLYLTRLDRAEELLRMSPPRFDDAEDHFREFIKEYPDHSDGYWGLVRARYGIKYEDDTKGKSVPSCYKSSYRDFRRDSDFLMALSCAENDSIYDNLQKKAKLIADVCKEWREEAGKYNYDVFISFKDEDRGLGISDADRNEMTDLYYYLRDQGYKVFFSPKSMNEYTGKHYDAYIFNALQSAKLMIVYGSKPEYFTSTWVQNEWTRFLRMMAEKEKKEGSCIVVYNDFDPYELPPALRKIQAIDASKQKRFYGEVLKSIRSILSEEKKPDTDEELRRTIDELKRQNEENQKRQEELQKSLEEEKKKNTVKQVEQKPTATSDSKKEPTKAPEKSTANKSAKAPAAKISTATEVKPNENENINVDPDFEIVKGTLVKYSGNKTYVVIPDNVNSIGTLAFNDCKSLTSVVIPDNVKFIGDEAFKDCSSLKSVTIPDSVTSIGDEAFHNCESLKSVTIPNNVTSIGDGAFSGCSSLKSATIPNGVTSIGDYVFAHCLNLKSVNIPDNITSIGDHAFYRCSNLESMTIPDSVEFIGNCAFADCSGLKSVTIPNSVTEFGNLAFYRCSSLKSATIPNSVTSIGGGAFSGCSSLTSITIPNSVTSIGDSAFKGCYSLKSVTIPNSVISIGKNAFQGCNSLTIWVNDQEQINKWNSNWNPDNRPVRIMEKETPTKEQAKKATSSKPAQSAVTTPSAAAQKPITKPIAAATAKPQESKKPEVDPDLEIVKGTLVKYKGNKATVVIPDSVTSIGILAFNDCKSLTSVAISNSVTSVGEFAFHNCTGLKSIAIPNKVTTIGRGVFSDCSSLTSVTIPDSVTSIGDYAFFRCSSLKSVTIPDSVTSIGDGAFSVCSNLKSVTFNDPKGWYIEGKRTPLLFLNNDSRARKYLTDKYTNCKWIKKK